VAKSNHRRPLVANQPTNSGHSGQRTSKAEKKLAAAEKAAVAAKQAACEANRAVFAAEQELLATQWAAKQAACEANRAVFAAKQELLATQWANHIGRRVRVDLFGGDTRVGILTKSARLRLHIKVDGEVWIENPLNVHLITPATHTD